MTWDVLGNASFSAVVGGLVGGIISWVISIRSVASGRRYAKFNMVELAAYDLQRASNKYWRKVGSDKELEREIKSLLERLDLNIQSLSRLFKGKRSTIEANINKFMDELTDEITGGDFETSDRRIDSVRVVRVKRVCKSMEDYIYKQI